MQCPAKDRKQSCHNTPPFAFMTEKIPGNLEITPRRLLLVEDHESTAQTLQHLLRRHGHEVWIALTCREALEMSDEHNVEVVVCDWDLPDGNGADLLTKICKKKPIRGIVLSGHGEPDYLRRSQEAGFAAHLVKPFDVREIEMILAQIFSEGKTADR